MNSLIQSLYIEGGLFKVILAEFIRGFAWALGAMVSIAVVMSILYKMGERK